MVGTEGVERLLEPIKTFAAAQGAAGRDPLRAPGSLDELLGPPVARNLEDHQLGDPPQPGEELSRLLALELADGAQSAEESLLDDVVRLRGLPGLGPQPQEGQRGEPAAEWAARRSKAAASP